MTLQVSGRRSEEPWCCHKHYVHSVSQRPNVLFLPSSAASAGSTNRPCGRDLLGPTSTSSHEHRQVRCVPPRWRHLLIVSAFGRSDAFTGVVTHSCYRLYDLWGPLFAGPERLSCFLEMAECRCQSDVGQHLLFLGGRVSQLDRRRRAVWATWVNLGTSARRHPPNAGEYPRNAEFIPTSRACSSSGCPASHPRLRGGGHLGRPKPAGSTGAQQVVRGNGRHESNGRPGGRRDG